MYAHRTVTQHRAICRHCRRQCPGGWWMTENEAFNHARDEAWWELVVLNGEPGWLCGRCLDLPFAEVNGGSKT